MGVTSEALKILKRMTGTLDKSTAEDIPSHVVSNSATHRRFSPSEYQVLATRHKIEPTTRMRSQNTDLTQIISYLKPSHEHSVLLVQDNERLRALAPEISQAENIIVSSIMSPNDLQEADPIISIGDVPNLSQTAKDQIIDLLTEFFIVEHKLGPKMAKWAGEALFRSGSAVTMILPESTLAAIIGHKDMLPKGDDKDDQKGQESLLEANINERTYLELSKKKIFSIAPATESSTKKISYKKESDNAEEKKAALEDMKQLKSYLELNGVTEAVLKEYGINENGIGLETIKARITTQIEEGDTIFLSENPEVLRFGSVVREYNKKKLGKSVLDQYKDNNGIPNSHQIEENIIDLTPYVDDSFKNMSAPFFIELPTEAVIPICVPGSKTEKLGYFVLIDAFGQPIEASKYLSTMSGCSTSGRIQASYAAMFGNKPTESGIKSSLFGNINKIGNPWDLQQNAISRVFDYVLDEMLRKKLKDVGLGDVDMEKYNSIATCMFYRLLEKKRTTLVFVPEELMTYIAFDYRDDGAGKSKLEDAQFILSLRVTFLVANLMAMMRNAVARKEIEISFDEKETQFESVIDEVRQAVNEKYRFSLSSDPTAIAQAINNQNMTLKIANHPNAPGFNISATDTQSQVPKADNELLDTLNSWFVTVLGVPHSVLNQLNEAEFSRSVATTNLFFSKMIRTYQGILCDHVSKYMQTTIRFYPTLQKRMAKILQGVMKKNTNNVTDTEAPETVTNNLSDESTMKSDQKDAIVKMLRNITKNIEVGLPAPNIAPDKAQYEIFTDYIRLIGELVDNLFPSELTGPDSELSDTFNMIKAFFKSSITKQFTTSSGLEGAFDLPTMDEFVMSNSSELKNMLKILRNQKAAFEKDKVAQTTESVPEGSEGEAESTDTSDSSASSDYGDWKF